MTRQALTVTTLMPATTSLTLTMTKQVLTVTSPTAVGVWQEESGESGGELAGHVPQSHELAGPGGTLHLQRVAVEVVQPLQVLNQQVVHWQTE